MNTKILIGVAIIIIVAIIILTIVFQSLDNFTLNDIEQIEIKQVVESKTEREPRSVSIGLSESVGLQSP
jgi:hypothetical protein